MTQKHLSDNSPIIISDSELDELQEFLLSDASPEGAMMLDTLDGFLTALIIGPVIVPPSAWLPLVWDMSGEGKEPEFESPEQERRIMELLMKMMNSLVMLLMKYPDHYEPYPASFTYESDAARDPLIKLWATGFMIGVSYNEADWEPLFSDETASVVLSAIGMLGVRPGDPVPIPTKKFRELWERVPDCVLALNEFWRPFRLGEIARAKGMALATEVDRIGRNEPCPCGSGKKFKKCCGR